MMTNNPVPLVRRFSPVAASPGDSEEQQVLEFFEVRSLNTWKDLDKGYRSVVLAEAGGGKTFEMLERARHLERQGRPAFFIRIEDIEDDFQHSFEVGSADAFEAWRASQMDAWFYLDSVDEARLSNPRTFEKAIRRFSREIKDAQHRAHVCISSRPYAWRARSDRILVQHYLPLPTPRSEPTREDRKTTATSGSQGALKVFLLQPLDKGDIRQFAGHRSVPDIDRLIDDLERANLMDLAGRPFDLEAILDKWASDRTLDGRSDLLRHNVETRLKESHDPDRALRQPLNLEQALAGARRLAAAVVLTGESGIQVPDSTHEQTGIDAEVVLSEWEPEHIRALLERGIFNDVIYGAVRFRHREVREFLAAGWFSELLQRGHSRHEIELLFFREQYGHEFISPRLRAVLPWLILDDNDIRERILADHPEIAMEGGDPARLPLPNRQKILSDVVDRLVRIEDYSASDDNSELARIAHRDLTDHALSLIDQYLENDDALFFLARLVWQGAMSGCVAPLVRVAGDPSREIYTRVAATLAVSTCGTKEQQGDLWDSLLTGDGDIPGRILAELVRIADEVAIPKLLQSIDRLPPDPDSSKTILTSALHDFVDRLQLPAGDGADEPFQELMGGLRSFLNRTPYFRPGSCDISKEFSWLLAPAKHAVERLVLARSSLAFNEHTLALLRTAPTARHWVDRSLDDRKSKLAQLISDWPELNDALFWYSDKATRSQREAKVMDPGNVLPLDIADHYWEFGPDSFERVLDWVRAREPEEEQRLALSLAFRIFVQSEKPSEWRKRLHDSVRGNPGLSAWLHELLNPVVSKETLEETRKWEEYQRKLERERRESAEARLEWIVRLKANPDVVRSPPNLKPGEMSGDQCRLLKEVQRNDERTDYSGAAWRTLIDEFGEEVARAYRDAAMAHWRRFTPVLGSEGGNTRSLPYPLLFAMAGLAIEAEEEEGFPRHLSAPEVCLALRYIVHELNGFPRWLEPMYDECPQEVLKAVLTELYWELDNTNSSEPMHYILHDLVYYAPWLHSALAEPLLAWTRCCQLPSDDALRYSFHILRGGNLLTSELAMVAKTKASDHSGEYRASWYALWVDVEPETGVDAVTTWLEGLDCDEGSHAAQVFITTFMGDRRHVGGGPSFEYFKTPKHLKSLYVLMHRHIRVAEDINRIGRGAYSPELRDEAQNARERVLNLLAEIPGKETYIALTDLAEMHSYPSFRAWMAKRARECAEKDGDLEPWTPQQVGEFDAKLTRTPETQRQLFDLTVCRVTDLKNWVERGTDSPFRTWQRAEDELEVRNLVAGWLNQKWGNPYTVAQEPELANRQRIDIWLQNERAPSPVPIELKLLDKGWSGPDLCKSLRNQLVGKYLRDATGGWGLMLLVWKGSNPERNWIIGGRRVGIPNLKEALRAYWETISNSFPNVAAVEVVLIDLTLRGNRSSV